MANPRFPVRNASFGLSSIAPGNKKQRNDELVNGRTLPSREFSRVVGIHPGSIQRSPRNLASHLPGCLRDRRPHRRGRCRVHPPRLRASKQDSQPENERRDGCPVRIIVRAFISFLISRVCTCVDDLAFLAAIRLSIILADCLRRFLHPLLLYSRYPFILASCNAQQAHSASSKSVVPSDGTS